MSGKFFYSIVPEPHASPPNFNFSIWMDSKFARKTLDKKISQKTFKWAQNWGNRVAYSCGLEDIEEYQPYTFVEEKGKLTYLLRSIELPKKPYENLCGLDFSSDSVSENIKDIKYAEIYYHPKNIENMEQSHILLMLWLEWAHLEIFINFLPKDFRNSSPRTQLFFQSRQ